MRLAPRFIARLFLLCIFLIQGVPLPVLAQTPPEESRPYLELPFPGETEYVVTCGYECYQHHGSMTYAVDLAIPEGAPVVAAAPGTVMAVTWEIGLPVSLNLGDALIVYIDHGEGWFTRYVHLSGVTVEVGEQVEMGDVIGYSGKTGASGDHLHFELKYGSALHSPSVPIDELFGGEAPLAGHSYVSNNYPLATGSKPPFEVGSGSPEPIPLPSPTSALAAAVTTTPMAQGLGPQPRAVESYVPEVASGLVLSASTVQAGEAVTATFTIRNSSSERLALTLLGIGSRAPGSGFGDEMHLHFDRNITLNPDRTYRFSRVLTFEEAGEQELFAFALGPDNEWIPLGGANQSALLSVEKREHYLFIPHVAR